MNIKDEFIDYLNRHNLTLVKAAAVTGISIGTLSHFINGKHRPHRLTAYKIRRLIEAEKPGKATSGRESGE